MSFPATRTRGRDWMYRVPLLSPRPRRLRSIARCTRRGALVRHGRLRRVHGRSWPDAKRRRRVRDRQHPHPGPARPRRVPLHSTSPTTRPVCTVTCCCAVGATGSAARCGSSLVAVTAADASRPLVLVSRARSTAPSRNVAGRHRRTDRLRCCPTTARPGWAPPRYAGCGCRRGWHGCV